MSINVEAEKRAYKKFRQAGMTAAGACGLIGNLEPRRVMVSTQTGLNTCALNG